MENKKVLITGGNGFLGSWLVNEFIKNQYEVLVISRSSSNLTDLLDKITFIQHNDDDYMSVVADIQKFSPMCVIHTAWDGGNSYSDINHLNQFYKNIPLSLSLLEVIRTLKTPPRFIGLGSFAEYGVLQNKVSEEDIESPVNFYGLSKLTVKNITELYCTTNNIPWTWIRPCYIYGPRDVPTRIIPKIINSLLSNKEIILDSCDVIVDYLHVNDFSKAVYSLVENNTTGVYNICSGNEYKLRDIIQSIYTILSPESTPPFSTTSNRVGVSKYICGSNNKLKAILDMDNSVNIHDGLLDTIHYHKTLLCNQ